MDFKLPRIYPITDVAISGLSHTEQVRRLIAGGARFIQLREKNAAPVDFYRDAREAVLLAHAFNAQIIINDRVDIALAVGADGVHLGQDDITPIDARKLLGQKFIVGLSTHSVEQASAAALQPVDYIAIGPIYETRSKKHPDAQVGLDGISTVRGVLEGIPLVAIGGITLRSVPQVIAAGADSAATIHAVLKDPEMIAVRYGELRAVANNVVSG